MTVNRREVLGGTLAIASRVAVTGGAIGAAASLASCGGGGGGGEAAPTMSAPTGLSYTSPAQATVGTAMTPLNPTVTGTVANYSVSPPLPAGLSINASTGVISGTPSAAAIQAGYTITASNAGGNTSFTLKFTVSAALAITAISNANPMALTPVSLATAGLDTSKSFTVTLANSSGSSVTVTPVRSQSDGTVIVPVPLVLDGSSGQTSSLAATLQIAQGNQTSAPIQINISDLPALSDLGLQPGQMSQAFNSYQTLAFASSINLHQAVGLLPTASGVPGALLTNLQTQLLATINARNVVDNIVANPGYSLPLGTASDGTAISFDATSASVLDRILAQYLAALTNQSAVNLSASVRQARGATSKRVIAPTISINQTFRSRSDRAQHADSHGVPAGLSTFVNTISTLGGAANIFSTGQTLLSGNSSTADKVLSVASTALSVVTIGATLVAATAAAPEIAAGAVAVAAWSALAGVGVGAAMVGNDVYNVATNYSDYLNSVPGSPSANLALKNAESAATNFVADSISTLLNASGIGAVESALTHSVTPAELSILGQALVPAADDVASGLKGLLTSTANIWAQSQFDDDINNAKANIGQGPLATPPTGDFTIVDGMVTISNANGPILSPLPGVEVNSSTTDGLLTTIGDVNGDYSLCVPLGSSSIPYSSTDISAYDPISGTVLGSTTVDLSNVSPDQTITGPSLTGTCTDTDATTPDGDDPDCD